MAIEKHKATHILLKDFKFKFNGKEIYKKGTPVYLLKGRNPHVFMLTKTGRVRRSHYGALAIFSRDLFTDDYFSEIKNFF